MNHACIGRADVIETRTDEQFVRTHSHHRVAEIIVRGYRWIGERGQKRAAAAEKIRRTGVGCTCAVVTSSDEYAIGTHRRDGRAKVITDHWSGIREGGQERA